MVFIKNVSLSILCFFKMRHKVCLEACEPWYIIFNYTVHDLIHTLNMNLRVNQNLH